MTSPETQRAIEKICYLLRTGQVTQWFIARDLLNKVIIEGRTYDQFPIPISQDEGD
jgi:hypothetical protein